MGKMVTANCPNCYIEHTFPEALYDDAMEARGTRKRISIYCPRGHGWHYTGENEETKLRRERDRLNQRLAQRDDEIREEQSRTEHARRSARAYKGQATGLRKRAKAGVCPCCNRQFKVLASHMKNKHPEYNPENPMKPLEVIKGGKAA